MAVNAYKIDHVAIAVNSIEETLPVYTGGIGLKFLHEEVVEDQMARLAFIEVGESLIELLEPTCPESPIRKFLDKKGPGIHHIAYAVPDVVEALASAKEAGYRLIDEVPRKGGHGKLIAFLHPKDTHGVLTEFCQRIPD
ncbi:methylmalonyl-CoA epimerase [Tumebacillus flagellatus]|uniref:Methylmalonyl-CoA epimerase n=1 Tax=Tumebacillus flagellatus TaxID=1157490 RepID=A0A074LPE1_9BACL|nr:methylmalonyl-CoA epimerase [Tumebacillus flagellatus]KEO82365.1 methylmalonyl-CoA epimerase [Tumebacillus flagellatus]